MHACGKFFRTAKMFRSSAGTFFGRRKRHACLRKHLSEGKISGSGLVWRKSQANFFGNFCSKLDTTKSRSIFPGAKEQGRCTVCGPRPKRFTSSRRVRTTPFPVAMGSTLVISPTISTARAIMAVIAVSFNDPSCPGFVVAGVRQAAEWNH